MKADWTGHTVGVEDAILELGFLEWENFDIRDMRQQGDVIEYDVSIGLLDFDADLYYVTDILIVYTQAGRKWELTSIETEMFRRI